MRLMSETLTSVWGPLSEPIHTEPLPEGRPAFRDHAWCSLGGRAVTIDGFGIRDRTWGYRDESVSIAEYIAVTAVFDDFALTTMRFVGADGTDRTEGYRLGETAEPVVALGVTRDASRPLAAAPLTTDGGAALGARGARPVCRGSGARGG